ncbi:anthrax toxin receptor-like [Bubalus kerabau]|uniref:anthrax toxin receptor-like n=1 Tax=Bubalus carabanensis TaxID=3119969 RepID=UPI00244E919E|nr:anthrax toxin receptor-like [Bubalus carabanensis]
MAQREKAAGLESATSEAAVPLKAAWIPARLWYLSHSFISHPVIGICRTLCWAQRGRNEVPTTFAHKSSLSSVWSGTVKEPPPLLKPEREPEETCQMPCPTVIVPCGCQGGGMKRMEGKLDSLCDFVQRCNQMSVMWCPTRDMGKCVNFALMRPHCGPLRCSPRACVQPSRECFTINNCCSRFQHSPSMCSRPPSRMQPFISTPARTANRAALSLQPP